MRPAEETVPVPDPTALTTAQLVRELGALRELLTTRLDAMDEATRLRFDAFLRIPEETKIQIGHQQALTSEKFASVFRMFDERDVRTAQASAASDQALKAALQAAKELVNAEAIASAAAAAKVETSSTKQIDQLSATFQTGMAALSARVTELKERIDRGEGQGAGRTESRSERRLDTGSWMQAIGTAVAVIGLVIVILVTHR